MIPSPTPVVLASASPRRRRLLRWLGLRYGVLSPKTAESLDSPLATDPPALAMSLAEEKMAASLPLVVENALVLTFDTIVVLDDELLGKPKDEHDARRMLEALSGRHHRVITGCCIRLPHLDRLDSFAVTSNVHVRKLTDGQIEDWLALGEYTGCAGAYNIEKQIAETSVDDCHQNVAGLPLCHVYTGLREHSAALGITGELLEPVAHCDGVLRRRCRLGPALLSGA